MKKLGIILITIGMLLVGYYLTIQIAGDTIISEIRKQTSSEVVKVPLEATQETLGSPQDAPDTETLVEVRRYNLTVSNKGNETQMDWCEGGFTQMTNYETLPYHTVYSAHNNCGGDIILPINIGDQVVIEGVGVFNVVDTRDTPKKITTEEISDLKGTVILQTCYYRENRMKFLGLQQIETMSDS